MLGIVCPSRFEYDALDLKILSAEGASVVLSGMGKVRAATGCARLRQENPSLRSVLLLGFAGGLSGLAVGDAIEPRVFIEQDYNAEPFEAFPNMLENPAPPLLEETRDALILTQDRFLTENPYKDSAYARRYPRIACDMESYAVAYFCREAGLRFAVLKLISDAADATADHDFLKACKTLSPKLNRLALEAVRAFDE